jgi:hypothetical protein
VTHLINVLGRNARLFQHLPDTSEDTFIVAARCGGDLFDGEPPAGAHKHNVGEGATDVYTKSISSIVDG